MSGEDLKAVIAEIRKEFGARSIVMGSDVPPVKHCPTGLTALDPVLNGGWPEGRISEIWGPECVSPETKVLLADLTWRRADALCVGDSLVTVDERVKPGRGRKRKMREGTVICAVAKTLERVRVVTTRGSIVVSAEHPFLRVGASGSGWWRADELRPGHRVKFFVPPWEAEPETWESGWLAGLLDGDGWVSKGDRHELQGGAGRVGVSQPLGSPIRGKVRDALLRLGMPLSITITRGTRWHATVKNRFKAIELLGRVRPKRLMSRSRRLWEGWIVGKSGSCIVKKVEAIGRGPVVALATSTRTLITDGFVTHNSAGKTTLVYIAIAACQRANPKAMIAYFDLENTFEKTWAEKCGVDTGRLLVVGPVPAEKVEALLLKFVRERWAMAVVDSIVEMIPQDVLEKEAGKQDYAVVARVMSRVIPKLTVLQGMSPTIVLMVNQVRDKIGFMFGEGQRGPGGHALHHADSLKLRVQRTSALKGGDLTKEMLHALGLKRADPAKKYGYNLAVKVIKSKVSREGEECRLHVLFDHGVFQEAKAK